MDKTKIKHFLPYVGIPVIGLALFFIHGNKMDGLALLLSELLILLGYIAAVLDIKTKSIPNKLILGMIAAWIIAVIPKLFIETDAAILLILNAAIGFLLGGVLFLIVYLISRKGLGGGDVKFMAAVGLYLGFTGVLSAMLYGTLLAALAGLLLIVTKKIGRKDSIPLAPFLYVGILITIFYQ